MGGGVGLGGVWVVSGGGWRLDWIGLVHLRGGGGELSWFRWGSCWGVGGGGRCQGLRGGGGLCKAAKGQTLGGNGRRISPPPM